MKIRHLRLIVLLVLGFPAVVYAGGTDAFLTPQEEESLFKGRVQSVDRLTKVISVNDQSFRFSRSTRFFMHNGVATTSWGLQPGMEVGLVVELGGQDEQERVNGQVLFDLSKVVILKSAGY
jgi:hypothetical protein